MFSNHSVSMLSLLTYLIIETAGFDAAIPTMEGFERQTTRQGSSYHNVPAFGRSLDLRR